MGMLNSSTVTRTLRRAAVTTLALSFALGQPAAGQDGDRFETLIDDTGDALRDIGWVWSAPVRMELMDLPVLFALGEAVIVTAVYDGHVQRWVRENPRALPVRALSPVREHRPLSRFGLTGTLLPMSAALYAAGLALDEEWLRDAGIGCATADVSNTLARHAIARLISRLRPEGGRGPYVIEPLGFGDWEMRSFPAGHGANAMACATFWNRRFDMGVAEPLLYLFAGAVGLGRIPDEAHWLSDTLFGAAFGWTVGNAVAGRFLDRRAERDGAGGQARRAARASPPVIRFGWRIAVP